MSDGATVAWRRYESEKLVVSAVLQDPQVAKKVFARVSADHIGHPKLRLVYEAALDLAMRGEVVDAITVQEKLRQQGRLAALGGKEGESGALTLLVRLLDYSWGDEDIDGHAGRVIRHARVRHFEALLQSGLVQLDTGADPEVVLASITQDLARLGGFADTGRSDDDLVAITASLMGMLEAGKPRGWAWPWKALEESVGRLLPGKMWVVVGYSGSGKSAWLRNLALGLIFDASQEVNVTYMAIEEGGEDVLGLMACARADVSYTRFGMGLGLAESELMALAGATNDIYNTGRFTLNRRKRWSPTELLAQTRVYAEEGKADIIIFDHAHLIDYPGRTEKERDHAAGRFAEDLHALADELGFCAVVAYQPRKPETGADEFRPVSIHDIRGTGRIINIVENTLSPFRPWLKWDGAWGREELDAEGRPVFAKKPGEKGSRLARNYAFVQPGKRRIGGYGGGPVYLPFDSHSGKIHE